MTPTEYSELVRKEAASAAQNTLDQLIEQGKLSEEEAIDSIVTLLDALVPLQQLLPGPIGAILEAGDHIVIRRVVEALFHVIEKEQLKSRRKGQREARKKRREEVRQEILSRMTLKEKDDG